MSDNNPPQRPPYLTSNFSSALDFIRSILHDQTLTSQVSPSGELYRAIERYHSGGTEPATDSTFRRHRRSSSSSIAHSISAVDRGVRDNSSSMSSGNSISRRFVNSSAPSRTYQDSRDALSLPPLRFSGPESRRSSSMSEQQEEPSYRRRPGNLPLPLYLRGEATQILDLGRDRERSRSDIPGDILSNLPPVAHGFFEYGTSRQADDAQPVTINPALISSPAPEDYDTDSRRIKRRKLETGFLTRNPGFRYGYYGQVEPGILNMELLSCDGGMYDGEPQYAAENILKNDNSVYCTKGNRCNILLRHQGAAVFTLRELVIKAPGTDFDAPVRNGFVFVSMEKDEVLNRTAKYQIQYKSPVRDEVSQERSYNHSDRSRGLSGNYHPLNEATFSSILTGSEGDPRAYLSSQTRRMYSLMGLGEDGDEHENENGNDNESDYYQRRDDEQEAQIPHEFRIESSEFNVTTECSDEEDGEALGRFRYRRAPNRIGSLPFESDTDDGQGSFTHGYEVSEDHARWRRRNIQRLNEFAEAVEQHQIAVQEAVRAVGGTLLKPLAKFSMDKDKNKCTIKFDPPASARFLLLKIWNPTHNPLGNIDIKAVVVKGFVGPRYFPSVQLR